MGNYPTYDIGGKRTWRPTDEGCLMRHMQETTFCVVCQEGLWTNLLHRLVPPHLLQGVDVASDRSGESDAAVRERAHDVNMSTGIWRFTNEASEG